MELDYEKMYDKLFKWAETMAEYTNQFDDLCDCQFSMRDDFVNHEIDCQTMNIRRDLENATLPEEVLNAENN